MLLYVLSALLVAGKLGHAVVLDHTWPHHQQCIGVNGPDGSSPDRNPTLLVNFEAVDTSHESGSVSIIVFNLRDEHLGGIYNKATGQKEVICTQANIVAGLCKSSQHGEFLLSDRFARHAISPAVSRLVNLTRPISIQYPITKPGYYCAATTSITQSHFRAQMRVFDPATPVSAYRLPRLRASTAYTGLLFLGVWLYMLQIEVYGLWSTTLHSMTVLAVVGEQGLDTVVVSLEGQTLSKLLPMVLNLSCSVLAVLRIWLGFNLLSNLLELLGDRKLDGKTRVARYAAPTTLATLEMLGRWLDMGVDESSRTVTLSTTIYGGCLAILLTMVVVEISCRSSSTQSCRTQLRGCRQGMLVATGTLLVLVLVVTTMDLVALVFGGQGVSFGQNYWTLRGWIMDQPFQGPLNLYVLLLVMTHAHCSS